MKREVKLALLKGIKEGILTKEHLKPPQVYIFIGQINGDSQELDEYRFKMNGRYFSNKERLEFIKNIELKNNALFVLGKIGSYENLKDTCISILFK
jgi:hypothetical protein